MAKTPSTMLPLGTKAPSFELPDTNAKFVKFESLSGKRAKLIMFICNHCPFVKHVASELARLGNEYQPKGVGMIAINANDAEKYPADNLENMALEKSARGYSFPYLYDQSQAIAKAYQAACTPDFYIFDANDKLVYRGQLDDSRPNS